MSFKKLIVLCIEVIIILSFAKKSDAIEVQLQPTINEQEAINHFANQRINRNHRSGVHVLFLMFLKENITHKVLS